MNVLSVAREFFTVLNFYTTHRHFCWGYQSKTRHGIQIWSHCGFVQYCWATCSYLYHWWHNSFQLNLPLCVSQCRLRCGLRNELRIWKDVTKIFQSWPRAIEAMSKSWKFHVSYYISLDAFRRLLLFWQINVFHKLHFSHKDFTAMKKMSLLGEIVTLLGKVKIWKERLNTSKGTKAGSYINKNTASKHSNWTMF